MPMGHVGAGTSLTAVLHVVGAKVRRDEVKTVLTVP